MLKQQSQQVRA